MKTDGTRGRWHAYKKSHKGFLKRFYLFIFRGGGRREKEGERNINVWLPLMWPPLGTWPTTQACVLTGNQACGPLICSPHSIH